MTHDEAKLDLQIAALGAIVATNTPRVGQLLLMKAEAATQVYLARCNAEIRRLNALHQPPAELPVSRADFMAAAKAELLASIPAPAPLPSPPAPHITFHALAPQQPDPKVAAVHAAMETLQRETAKLRAEIADLARNLVNASATERRQVDELRVKLDTMEQSLAHLAKLDTMALSLSHFSKHTPPAIQAMGRRA